MRPKKTAAKRKMASATSTMKKGAAKVGSAVRKAGTDVARAAKKAVKTPAKRTGKRAARKTAKRTAKSTATKGAAHRAAAALRHCPSAMTGWRGASGAASAIVACSDQR